MNRDAMIAAVRSEMPERRWNHTLGVMETSIILANRFGADPARAEQAAILHDVAKYWKTSRMETVIHEEGLPADLLEYDKELWHAPVGAFVAESQFGVTDVEIIDAIRFHTSGRIGITLMDKVVCLADYMEPGRDFPAVHKIRELAEHSLEKALIAGFTSTISYLLEQGKRIYPLTVAARNDLLLFVQEAEQ